MPTILLIEDNPLILDYATSRLTKLGVSVIQASTFEEALDRLALGGYDLILSDVLLDGGHDASELFQVKPDKPLVLWSGLTESVPEELRAMSEVILEKPVGFELVADLARCVESKAFGAGLK